MALVAALLLVECFLPLRTAIQLGGDEGMELGKATVCLRGHHLYTEIWNDQPPLHTFLITQVLKHCSPSILGPRLVTVAFSLMLLVSFYRLVSRISGAIIAVLAATILIASPGFLVLSGSCMLEIPALAMAMAALCVLVGEKGAAGRWHFGELVAGALFGAALLMKLVPIILLPVAALLVWMRSLNEQRIAKANPPHPGPLPRGEGESSATSLQKRRLGYLVRSLVWIGVGAAVAFVGLDLLIERGAYLRHFQQSWISHFGAAKSFEYGSPAEHPFDWSILLKHWDATLPALIGLWVCITQARKTPLQILPAAWLAWSLAIFGFHKPWWSYYYVHTAIPLCWLAAVGVAVLFDFLRGRDASVSSVFQWSSRTRTRTRTRTNEPLPQARPTARASRSTLHAPHYTRPFLPALLLTLYALCALPWMGTRLYAQIAQARNSPQTYNSLVLAEMARYKPHTEWLYAEDPIYSFHSGIPMPPNLAVVMYKRLWSGEMTNDRLAAEVSSCRPGLILLRNDSHPKPFDALLRADYHLAYEDSDHRLYVLKSLAVSMQ